MGGLVIETVRPGVQFIPDAAAAFRRADAQVRLEFGRGIDVNSTYRSWSDQMLMFVNWGKYVNGQGPYPGHSKAVHPSESFHVQGVALDSDDWRISRIVEILAENGFIRNRLHVPNENHHFEWLRNRDQNYGKPIPGTSTIPSPLEDDDMKLIRWNSNHVFAVGREAIYHIPDVAQLGALEAVHGAAKDVDNTGLTSVLLANGIHWDAVDAVLRGLGNVSGGKYWSRLAAEGVAIRGAQAAQSKTLADVLETAKSIGV